MPLTVNPTTERVEAEYAEHDEAAVRGCLRGAATAYAAWRRRPLDERTLLLRAVAARLRAEATALADLVTREMGKPIGQSRAEVEKCAWVLEHYAEHAAAMLAPEPVSTPARESGVRFDPLGVVLAIMPWNFPLWQVFRCAAPVLAAGNAVVLKHAPNVTGCALAIERLFAEAGAPGGVLSTLILSNEATEGVIGAPEVAAVTLTGSVRAGRRVGALAGAAVKKCVLELGGSDAFIVLADADLELAVERAVASRTLNNGQSCIAAKRFLVEGAVGEPFVEALTARMSALRVGDPADAATELGPLARADLRDALAEQVRASVAQGARVCTGGAAPDGVGFFHPPTVLADAAPGMPVFDEETFGPVAAVTRVEDLDHAISLANHSRYGLGASVWTRDLDRARFAAARLDAGAVFVNEVVKSDPRVPFGGVKDSGYGRELGRFGIREFINVKTVWIA